MTSTTTLTPTGPLTLDYDAPFLDYAAPGDRWVSTPTHGRVTCPAVSDGVASVDGNFVCTRIAHRAEQPHVAAGTYDVKAVWHDQPYVPAVDERVRVTSMRDRAPSPDYQACVGRYGKVVRHSPTGDVGVVEVAFEDTRYPQRAYATTVVAVPPLAPDAPPTQPLDTLIGGAVVRRLGQDLIGTRVRVLRRTNLIDASPGWDGQTGTIVRLDTGETSLPIKVAWDDTSAPRGEEGWVHSVERIDAAGSLQGVPADTATDAPSSAPAVDPEVARLTELVRVLRTQAADHMQWRDTLVADAHQYANDQDFCSTFDDFMEEHDLPRRSRAYRVTAHVTVEVEIDLDLATDEADAEQQVNDMDSDDIRRHINGADVYELGVVEHTARDARVI